MGFEDVFGDVDVASDLSSYFAVSDYPPVDLCPLNELVGGAIRLIGSESGQRHDGEQTFRSSVLRIVDG